ncbi:MAG: RNA polymerase sigma factor [Lachnospiraceae bacterium]|nr:RNA polymerase sigma factor [Lachnospiraceae bacterium]
MYEREELEEIIKEFGDMVYRFAYAQVKNSDMADDVYQNVWLRLIHAKHRIEPREHLKAWLLRTTGSCCKDVWKSSWYRKMVFHTSNELQEDEQVAEAPEEEGFVTECVRRLPERYRGMIHLYYYEGYSQKEIAELLGMKENTVASRLARGRERLKKMIESDEVKRYEY